MTQRKPSLFYYVPKLLKNVSDCYITSESKIQLSHIVVEIAEKIIQGCVRFLTISGKSVLNVRTLVNASRLIFSGELLINMLKEGDVHIKIETTKGVRESLVFSPSMFRHIVEQNIPQHIKISSKFPIFLASIMEYLCAEILDLSSVQVEKRKHVRISPRDIFLAIQYDAELTRVFCKCNIKMLGCGVVPRKDELDTESRRLQTSVHMLLPKASMNSMIRALCDDVKISKSACILLQQCIENFIIELLQETERMCKSTGKIRITEDDLKYVFQSTFGHL